MYVPRYVFLSLALLYWTQRLICTDRAAVFITSCPGELRRYRLNKLTLSENYICDYSEQVLLQTYNNWNQISRSWVINILTNTTLLYINVCIDLTKTLHKSYIKFNAVALDCESETRDRECIWYIHTYDHAY